MEYVHKWEQHMEKVNQMIKKAETYKEEQKKQLTDSMHQKSQKIEEMVEKCKEKVNDEKKEVG